MHSNYVARNSFRKSVWRKYICFDCKWRQGLFSYDMQNCNINSNMRSMQSLSTSRFISLLNALKPLPLRMRIKYIHKILFMSACISVAVIEMITYTFTQSISVLSILYKYHNYSLNIAVVCLQLIEDVTNCVFVFRNPDTFLQNVE